MLVEAISSFLVGAIERLGKKAVDKCTQPSAKETNNDKFRENYNQTDQEIWNIITLYGRYKEAWSIYRTEGLLEAIKVRDEKIEFDRQVESHVNSQSVYQKPVFLNQNNSNYDELNDLEIAVVRSTASHFEKMQSIIIQYHQDYNASKKEAEILANYYRQTAVLVKNVMTKQDLKQLIKHIKSLAKNTKRYKHKKSKYCWYKGLKNILDKLKTI